MKRTSNHTPATIPVIDALDQAIACQENIFVIGSLLADSSTLAADSHENRVRSGVGRLLANEARKLDILLQALEEHYPRPTKRPRSKASIRPHQT
jgi:hypothetical protein